MTTASRPLLPIRPLRMLPVLLALLSGPVVAEGEPSSRAPGAAAAPGAETAAADVRIYDLSLVRPGYDVAGQAEALSPALFVGNVNEVTDVVEEVEESWYEPFEPDTIAELLAVVLGEELEFEGRWMELFEDDQLLVAGPPELHARVQAVLSFLAARFDRREELIVDVVHLPLRPEPGLLAPGLHPTATVDAWLGGLAGQGAGRARRRSFTLQLEPGRTGMVDLSREVTFVNDYDVEVAQASFVHDPVLSTARVGTRILARGSNGPGGLYLALVVKHADQLGELTEREVTLSGLISSERSSGDFLRTSGLFHELRLLRRAVAVNAWLPDDRALVLSSSLDLRSGGDHELVVLRRGRRAAAAPPASLELGDRRLVVVDQETVRPAAFEHLGSSSWDLRQPSHLVGYQFWGNSAQNPLQMTAVLRFPELPARIAWLARRTEDEDGWVERAGPWWFLVGPAELELPRAPAPETVEIELVLRGGSRSPQPARLSLVARIGQEAFAALGIESSTVADFDVEVAQFASASDPVPLALFDGLLVRVRPGRGADGRLHLEVKVQAHLQTGLQEGVGLEGFYDREISLPEFEHLFVDERLVLEEGAGRVVLGNAAGLETAGGLALEVRVR